MHTYLICVFILQDSIRINVTTLEDGEVSKEQVCLCYCSVMVFVGILSKNIRKTSNVAIIY